MGVIPVVDKRFALDGEHRRAARGDGGSGVVLGREDVARGPAHFGAKRGQRLDQHRGLDGHVQRTGDARALQRLVLGELFADGHQTGHLGLGDLDLFAAPRGQVDVGDDVVFSRHKLSIQVYEWAPLLLLNHSSSLTDPPCGDCCSAPRRGC